MTACRVRSRSGLLAALALPFALACSGDLTGSRAGGSEGATAPGVTGQPSAPGAGSAAGAAGSWPGSAPGALGLGANGITRLSREEYRSTLRSLLGVDVGVDAELLPADSFAPFDNDYTLQVPSRALVEGLKAVAERAATRVFADPALRAALVGCTPASANDAGCLRDFVARFGRRALRRPLAPAEVEAYLAFLPFAAASNDFYTAASMVVRAMLQDLELAYRVEIGEPVAGAAGVYRLGDFELASRLSYLLWGENPDDALLDQAGRGQLRSDADVRAAAERLLADPRGLRRIERFHALWLGYDTLPHAPELNAAMRAETDALVARVIFEQQRPWLDLFTAQETWANAALADSYGLSGAPASGFAWLRYPDGQRRGLLAHGSVLSNGVSGGDTSPTRRGKFIQERLACTPIPPPPAEVKADEPPPSVAGKNCKADRYAAHRSQATCAGCHSLMDGVGFGLENYDVRGRYRAHDEGKPECVIDGQGDLPGSGAFRGPGELGALMVASGSLTRCLVERVYQFAVGRAVRPEDASLVAALADRGGGAQLSLRRLVLDWVSSEGFRTRTVDER